MLRLPPACANIAGRPASNPSPFPTASAPTPATSTAAAAATPASKKRKRAESGSETSKSTATPRVCDQRSHLLLKPSTTDTLTATPSSATTTTTGPATPKTKPAKTHKYFCRFGCTHPFSDGAGLRSHMNKVHNLFDERPDALARSGPLSQCTFCYRKFRKEAELDTHWGRARMCPHASVRPETWDVPAPVTTRDHADVFALVRDGEMSAGIRFRIQEGGELVEAGWELKKDGGNGVTVEGGAPVRNGRKRKAAGNSESRVEDEAAGGRGEGRAAKRQRVDVDLTNEPDEAQMVDLTADDDVVATARPVIDLSHTWHADPATVQGNFATSEPHVEVPMVDLTADDDVVAAAPVIDLTDDSEADFGRFLDEFAADIEPHNCEAILEASYTAVKTALDLAASRSWEEEIDPVVEDPRWVTGEFSWTEEDEEGNVRDAEGKMVVDEGDWELPVVPEFVCVVTPPEEEDEEDDAELMEELFGSEDGSGDEGFEEVDGDDLEAALQKAMDEE